MNKRIYFSIIPVTSSGFTDQLIVFSAFYRLGISMNFEYAHLVFKSNRSKSIEKSITKKIYDKILSILRLKNKNNEFDIFDYMGFNSFFSKIENIGTTKKIEINFSDLIFEEKQIKTIESLKKYVQTYIDKDEECYLVFKLTGSRNFFSIINNNFPIFNLKDLILEHYLDFKNINISKKREANVLIHIRLGDICIFNTPWNTFIPLDERWENYLKEYSSIEEIYTGNLLQPTEYYNFINNFTKLSGLVKIHVFSDGYQRVYKPLLNKFRNDSGKIKLLKKFNFKKYDDLYINKLFSNITNQIFVGESNKNLIKLLDFTINSEIIVTSCYQSMLIKFLSVYGGLGNKIIISLYKQNDIPDYSYITSNPQNIIHFNINSGDYGKLINDVFLLQGKINTLNK